VDEAVSDKGESAAQYEDIGGMAMSKDSLAKVVQRAISDAGFRRQLSTDPAGALRGFKLSADEMSAIRTGDAGRLSALGVDQRMSKAFALAGTFGATRVSASDLSSSVSMVDDGTGAGVRTVIPNDPIDAGSADADSGATTKSAINDDPDGFLAANAVTDTSGSTPTVHAGDDWKFAGRVAPDSTSTVRAGDDWKFADHTAAQGSVAPVEGSPEATAADIANSGGSVRIGDDWKFDHAAAQGSVAPVEGSPEATAADIASSGGMANYPAHDGLAGPSGVHTVRAGDDWARAGAQVGDAASGTSPSVIHDDPDGFLAANADAGGGTSPSVIHDDPDGFLAANADAGGDVVRANVINDDPDGFLAANANADATGGSAPADAFIDDSEGYLTKVGYDGSQATTPEADTTWSGEDIAGPAATDDTGSADAGNAVPDSGPHIAS